MNYFSLGTAVYSVYLVRELFTYKPQTVELQVDDQRFRLEKTWFVTVSNQPFYGGGMKIAPNANPTDGELCVTVVHHLSKVKLLCVFISVFWGGHLRFKEVNQFKESIFKF
ncbi:diacylglycerol/lipid kinase family protein [Bacillus sp. N9]